MVFNSLTFLVFLGLTLLVYYKLRFRTQNVFLLLASYVFYGWWDWRFLSLLIFTSLFDYFCGLRIEQQQNRSRRRLWLAFSIILNMGVLCAFKYFNFFAESFAALLDLLGMKMTLPVLHVILPLGISFYTFLSMSYTIDVYRGEMKATRDPVAFMLFVAFFPHLVAGPIVRASFLLPQCQTPRTIKYEQVTTGIWLILLGYLKKVVIADRMASIVDLGFSPHGGAAFSDANSWLILYAFAFQIYGDFSGYSDIARGLSKIMGFELPINFRAPYLVSNPAEFWHHWHITLSTWLRDYLYIPLGGNRKGHGRTYVNLMTTMVLGGLWHGAGVAFLLWGAYHGLLLAVHRAWSNWRKRSSLPLPAVWPRRLGRIILVILFFHVTCVGWLLFRAGALPAGEQFPAIQRYLDAMLNLHLHSGVSPLLRPVLLLGALGLILQWKCEAMDQFNTWRLAWKVTAVVATLAAIAAFGVFKGAQFIYFQF